MKITSSVVLVLALACVLASASAADAQSKPKQYANVLTVQATPQGALEYEAFVKKTSAAALKLGQTRPVLAYQVTTGGPGYTYMFISYFDKWGETDDDMSPREMLFKALGEAEGAKVVRAGRMNIASTESAVFRLLPELSTKPKAYDPPPPYLQVFRNYLKPGMSHEWERAIARYKAAADQNPDAPTAMRRVSVEGQGALYVTSTPYNRPGDRDAWPTLIDVLKKAYGDEEARSLDQARLSAIDHSEAFILKFRPDLSRLPK